MRIDLAARTFGALACRVLVLVTLTACGNAAKPNAVDTGSDDTSSENRRPTDDGQLSTDDVAVDDSTADDTNEQQPGAGSSSTPFMPLPGDRPLGTGPMGDPDEPAPDMGSLDDDDSQASDQGPADDSTPGDPTPDATDAQADVGAPLPIEAGVPEQPAPLIEVPTLTIDWSPSGQRVGTRNIESATFEVPADYANPDGAKIRLALARLVSNSPNRRGVVLFNPGGPGAAVVPDAEYLLSAFANLFPNFDILLMDNRGMGRSTAMRCLGRDGLAVSTNDTGYSAEVQLAAQLMLDIQQGCRTQIPDLLPFMNSENVARDMEALRLALGEEQLNFWGVSYGTMQGALYPAMFPDRVRAWVIDSPVLRRDYRDPHSVDELTHSIAVYEAQLERFFADCDSRFGCTLSERYPGGTAEAWDTLQQILDDGLVLGGMLVWPELLGSISETALRWGDWALLEAAIDDALDGDWQLVMDALMAEDGESEQDTVNSTVANVMISRIDFGCPEGFETSDAVAAAEDLAARLPRLGRWQATRLGLCVGWDYERSEPPVSVHDLEAPPLVVMSAIHDPATPHEDALELVEVLGNGSRLMTSDVEGHGAGSSSDCGLVALVTYIDSANPDDVPQHCNAVGVQQTLMTAEQRAAGAAIREWLATHPAP